MVLTVRCFKCGEDAARLVLGGRAILQARCEACDANLLAEVLELEEEATPKRVARRQTYETVEISGEASDEPTVVASGEF